MEDKFSQASEKALALKRFCHENGGEKDSIIIAKKFLEIGELYQNIAWNLPKCSQDQILNLLRAFALYNAAKIRFVDNSNEGKLASSRIHDLIGEVSLKLFRRNPKMNLSDLWDRSLQEIRSAVLNMRNNAHIKFEILNSHFSVDDTFALMKEIAQNYGKVVTLISNKCIKFLSNEGMEQPTPFSHVSLGSLAREDITPYSDFESMIILPDMIGPYQYNDDPLAYWRCYAFLFECFLISLNETPLRNYCIPGLNSFDDPEKNWFWDRVTSPGFRSDSNMPFASKTPLGRQPTKNRAYSMELIKPLAEMIQLLETDQARQNGYHLQDILLWSRYICGDENIHKEFVRRRPVIAPDALFVEEGKPWHNKLRWLNGTTNLGGPVTARKLWWKLNMKNEFHRKMSIFLLTVARLSNISLSQAETVVSMIQELDTRKVLSFKAVENLKFAYAITYRIRMKQYSKNGQADNVYAVVNYILSRHFFKGILEGKTADDYFSILAGIEEAGDQIKKLDANRIKELLRKTDLFSTDDEHIFELRDRYDFLNNDLRYEAMMLKRTNSPYLIVQIFRQSALHFFVVNTVYSLLSTIEDEVSKNEINKCAAILKSSDTLTIAPQLAVTLLHKLHIVNYLLSCALLTSDIPKISVMLADEENFKLDKYILTCNRIMSRVSEFPKSYFSKNLLLNFGKLFDAMNRPFAYAEGVREKLKNELSQYLWDVPSSNEKISDYMANIFEEIMNARLVNSDVTDETNMFDVYNRFENEILPIFQNPVNTIGNFTSDELD